MANRLYPLGANSILKAQVDFESGSFSAVLLPDSYTYSATHEFLSDLGPAVGSKSVLTGMAVSGGSFDADDVAFGPVAGGSTVRAMAIIKDTGNASTSPVLIYFDDVPGFPFLTNGADVTIRWPSGAGRILSLV